MVDHPSYMLRYEESRKLLPKLRHTNEVSVEDNMLDISEAKRAAIGLATYVDRTISNINPSVLSDRFLRTLPPLFTIRHPAKQIESWYKASRLLGLPVDHPLFEVNTTYRFSR